MASFARVARNGGSIVFFSSAFNMKFAAVPEWLRTTSCATCMDLLAAFARWTIQVALTFAGKGKERFIQLDDSLQALT